MTGADILRERAERDRAELRVRAKPDFIDAADLIGRALPPLREVCPGIFIEGTTILASRPKVGKSCLIYQLVVEVSIGGELFGRRVESGSALYYALEDGARRGQARLLTALAGRTMPRGRLDVAWSAPAIGEGLEEEITAWLDDHADALVVVIDTLGKVKSRRESRRSAYDVDVATLARLQALFRNRGVALVIVHHARKEAADDFLASVSGTYGLTGSADTIVVVKRPLTEEFGTVNVTGRDIADATIPVRFTGGRWSTAPDAMARPGAVRTDIFRVIEEFGPIFPQAIAQRLGLDRTAVAHVVERMVGVGIERRPRGYVVSSYPHHSDHSLSDESDVGMSVRARAQEAGHGDKSPGHRVPIEEDDR